jgi:large subunit ribosomal protein L23
MGLFDFFRKKKKPEKKIEKKKVEKRVEKKVEKKVEAKPEIKRPRKKVSGTAYRVLTSVHVTEKATGLEAENKYVFNVSPKANKTEIKKAVQNLYGVNVVNVRIINIPRKQRRLGRQKGWRKGYKKAIVRISKGQRIEIMPR